MVGVKVGPTATFRVIGLIVLLKQLTVDGSYTFPIVTYGIE